MDLSKNYYNILKLSNEVTTSEIKKAYRKLAHLHHPDKNTSQNAKQKFQEIQDAYQVLNDKQQKHSYDNNSHHGRYYKAFQFNFSSGKSGYEEHLNINTEVEITLSDIYTNRNKTFTYSRNISCKVCKGTGFEPNDNWSECLFCSGKGTTANKKCKYCKGIGRLYRNQCSTCKGNKVLKNIETITIKNLYTVENRKTIRYPEYGHQSKYFNDRAGELIVFIKTKDEKTFTRKEDNLYIDVDVHFTELIIGNSIEVALLDDSKYAVKIPGKTKSGQIFKIKEKGFLKKNKQRADLFIKVNVIIDYSKVSDELIDYLNGKNDKIQRGHST